MSRRVSALVSPRPMESQDEVRPHTLERTCVEIPKRCRLGQIHAGHMDHAGFQDQSTNTCDGQSETRDSRARCDLVARCEFTLLPDVFAETVTSRSRASGKNTGRLQS